MRIVLLIGLITFMGCSKPPVENPQMNSTLENFDMTDCEDWCITEYKKANIDWISCQADCDFRNTLKRVKENKVRL